MDYLGSFGLIGLDKGSRKSGFCFWVPFEFKGMDFPINLLDVVDFLSSGSAPEIGFSMETVVAQDFLSFGDKEILPKCPDIRSSVYRTIVADY